jgi:hypothetical protein
MTCIPDDFPRRAFSVVSGARPKVCVVVYKDGKYRGNSFDELPRFGLSGCTSGCKKRQAPL